MWWDVLRTGFILTLPGASQWRLQISACSAIGCLSVTSAMEISTLLTQLPVSSLEPYSILAVTRLKSMDSGRCRLAEAIPTQARRTSCSLQPARTMNRMGCWASLVQSPPNSAETPNRQKVEVAAYPPIPLGALEGFHRERATCVAMPYQMPILSAKFLSIQARARFA